MQIFIDESGIHKTAGLSVVMMVVVPNSFVDKFGHFIETVESDLRIGPFHWSSQGWRIKKSFLRKIFTAEITQKMTVEVTIKSNPLYYYDFLSESIAILLDYKDMKNLIFDGQKSHSYERRIKKILRTHGISTKILSIQRDESSPLLRLADALAGLFRIHFENPEHRDAADLFNFILHRLTVLHIHQL